MCARFFYPSSATPDNQRNVVRGVIVLGIVAAIRYFA